MCNWPALTLAGRSEPAYRSATTACWWEQTLDLVFFINCSQLCKLHENRHQTTNRIASSFCRTPRTSQQSGQPQAQPCGSAEPRLEALAIRPGKSYKVVRNNKQAADFQPA